jgi:hypothetical protein
MDVSVAVKEPWETIPGWFTYQHWYERIAQEAPPGSTLVELGVFCGKGLAYLAEKTKHKGCKVIGIDTFLGSPEFVNVFTTGGTPFSELPPGYLAQECTRYLEATGYLDDVKLIVSDSAKAAELFADGSVWSVFIDAGHDADSVELDVRAWWPKVKIGGYLAGDDWGDEFPGVQEGVQRVFPHVTGYVGGVWAIMRTEGYAIQPKGGAA